MARVEIYTTPWCAYCKMAKEFFKKKGVEYTEHDVADDPIRRQEMIDKTHQMGVPVIIIDGQIVIGFDREKITELLKIK